VHYKLSFKTNDLLAHRPVVVRLQLLEHIHGLPLRVLLLFLLWQLAVALKAVAALATKMDTQLTPAVLT
jgi:hypothetical protein